MPDITSLVGMMRSNAGLGRVAGGAVRNCLIDHYRRKDRLGNKLGGQRTHFWQSVSRTVSSPSVNDRTIRCVINHPHVAIHVKGGRVRPTKAKRLTIPVHPAAHGRSPRSFNDLVVLWGKRGPYGLGTDPDTPYFVFAKVARIPRDPSALPKTGTVHTAMSRAITIQLRKLGM